MIRAAIALLFLLTAAAPAAAQAQRLPPSGFADLAERLSPAVVNIATTQRVEGVEDLPRFPRGSPLERFNEGLDEGAPNVNSLGSGFIISADGVVVTNNHVIEGADTIEVILQSGARLPAELVGRDVATDLAVLRVRSRTPLPFVPWGDSDRARVGDLVIAIGNPFGLGGTVTLGIVSARNRNIDAGRYDDFIQTDAAINRGNSGGPLFNMEGEVIGVNTAIVSPTGGSVGVGFAMPSALVRPVINQILQYGEARRGWLGVRLTPVTPEIAERNNMARAVGAIVTRVTPGGPAQRAGVRRGDIIVAFDGREIADSRMLTRIVADARINSTVQVVVLRNGRRVTLNVTIQRLAESTIASVAPSESREQSPGPGARLTSGRVLGMSLTELSSDIRRRYDIDPDIRGLVVTAIDPTSDAHGKLRIGDVIVEMAFEPVGTVAQARALADRAQAAGRPLLVHVSRGEQMTFRSIATRR
ncbi:MAG: Do family serine endopeptidase [Hyphomonadaceae bacterium]